MPVFSVRNPDDGFIKLRLLSSVEKKDSNYVLYIYTSETLPNTVTLATLRLCLVCDRNNLAAKMDNDPQP